MTTSSTSKPLEVTVLLLEQFAMIAFSSTVEPLREANWVAGRKAYEWKVVSHDGRPVRASNGLMINVDGSIKDIEFSPIVIVCSSFDPHLYTTPGILTWLRKMARMGAHVGAIETGTYVLARAGILDNYRATIHWENTESFAEEFPKVRLTERIFEIDRRRFTASGAAAAMDMMLHFIAVQLGRNIALAVAEAFIYSWARDEKSRQKLGASERLHTRQPRLRRLLRLLDSHLDDRLDVNKMAASENISEREVRRLFRRYLGSSPQAYHRSLRLQKARLMLRQTSMSVSDVALSCGFASGSDFSRAFKREFGLRPLLDRGEVYSLDRSAILSLPSAN